MLVGIILVVIVTSHIEEISGIPCQVSNKHDIEYEREGQISLGDCRATQDPKCDCTWTFHGVPSEENDLILNMTAGYSPSHVITLNDDPFIGEDDPSRCKVLLRRTLNMSEAMSLQDQYPGCEIMAGVDYSVTVTYQFSDISIPFTIEYHVTGNVATRPPDTTTSSTVAVTSPIVTTLDDVESTTTEFTSSLPGIFGKTSTLPTPPAGVGGWNLPQTYTIAIVVGSVAVALIMAVFVMLFIIRKRHNKNIRGENRLNIIYDNDIPQYATVDDYKEIQNGKNGGFTKQDFIKEEVLNPLYSEFSDDSAPVSPLSPYPPTTPRIQNSYEYIDIEIGNRG